MFVTNKVGLNID